MPSQSRMPHHVAARVAVLLALLQAAAPASLIGAEIPSDSCLAAARQHPSGTQWLEEALAPRSRSMPKLDSTQHGVSDWPEGQQPIREHAGALWDRCSKDVFRYRVYKGVVYADHSHHSSWELYPDYREVFLEQLLTAIYLYKEDFPDVELIINLADLPVACDMSLPFMQYSVIDLEAMQAQHITVQAAHLVWDRNEQTMRQPDELPASGPSQPGYTRGVTLPYTHAWDRVSLSPAALRNYTACLDARHSPSGWASKRASVIWRGSPTGYQRGWHSGAADGSRKAYSGSFVARALLNKRIYLAALAMRYPWMDVGITGFLASGAWDTGVLGLKHGSVFKDMKKGFSRGFVDAEAWTEYMLQLSMDGHGSPWRLPQQLLGGSVVVAVDSPLKGFLAGLLQPGIHYEPVAYDLSDVVLRTKTLVEQAQTADGSLKLQRIANQARELAVEQLGLLGQLDSFMWSVLKVKQLCPWAVEKPGRGWRRVKLKRNRHWISYGTAPIKEAIMHSQAANFR